MFSENQWNLLRWLPLNCTNPMFNTIHISLEQHWSNIIMVTPYLLANGRVQFS
jgi:hypothetical protein